MNKSYDELEPTLELYREPITRNKRGLFVFLLDQSNSMNHPATLTDGYQLTLAQIASFVINTILIAIIDNTNLDTSTGRRRNYCDIIIFGYDDTIKPLLNEAGLPIPLPDLAEKPRGNRLVREEEYDPIKGKNVPIDKMRPYWIEPDAKGKRTEMAGAIDRASQVVEEWIAADDQRKKSFPPIVINITDGSHNGARGDNPIDAANRLRQLHTNDGNVLLFNCHITPSTAISPIYFPNKANQLSTLPEEEQIGAKQLFEMSSRVPATMVNRAATAFGMALAPEARGFMYNASGKDLIRFLAWGTLVKKKED